MRCGWYHTDSDPSLCSLGMSTSMTYFCRYNQLDISEMIILTMQVAPKVTTGLCQKGSLRHDTEEEGGSSKITEAN